MSLYDLEEDYEKKYPDGWRPDPKGDRMVPVGQCDTMCPIDEMQEREKNRRLHKYEMKPNKYPPQVNKDLAIKEFKRSCVGRELAKAIALRPWSVIKRTLDYLLLDICLRNDDWMFVCDYVFDRLKALRQDIVIQRIEGRRYIEVLEGSIRFLVYSLYRLTCTLRDFSSDEPMKQVISLEGPVSGLNNYDINVVREMKLTLRSLRDCLNSLIIQYQENVPDSPNRALFEGVNLITNLPFLHGHLINLTEFQANKDLRNSDSTFQIVFKIYREHLAGHHYSALKLVPKLSDQPLLILAYAPALGQLQMRMLQMLRKAYYSPGPNTSSVEYLCNLVCPRWLEPEDEDSRLLFGKFLATQFEFYDSQRKLCDFKLKNGRMVQQPRDFVEKAILDHKATQLHQTIDENETRIYALQMIISRNWSFFRETLETSSVVNILSP